VAPPSVYHPEVPLGLDAVVLKALSRDPADRFDSGDEMAAALMQVERIAGGRQRVAEFVAKIFPATFAAVCEVCGKPASPGFACAECGNEIPTEAPSTQNVRIEDLIEIMSDEDLEPEIIHAEPIVTAEPYPLATIVDPRRPGPSRVRRALAIAGAAGVIASVAALRMYTPSWSRTPVPPKREPRRADEPTQPIRVVPTPVPVVCPPPAAPVPQSQPQEAAPVKSRDDMPTQPLPVPAKNKVARVQLKKAPASAAHHAPPRSEPAKRGEVRHGALLDPFGQDD
jgi:hypothetical protein